MAQPIPTRHPLEDFELADLAAIEGRLRAFGMKDADDRVGEACVKVCENGLKDGEAPKQGVFVRAAQLDLHAQRARGRYAQHVGLYTDEHETEFDPRPALEARDEGLALQRKLEELPDREREVLRLRIYQELSLREICGRLGINYEQAKGAYRRAITRLRKKIA